jgi:hypothetical protein
LCKNLRGGIAKKLFFLLVGSIIIGCGPDYDSVLNLSITAHPQGGQYIQTLSCSFEGYTEWFKNGDPEPIIVRAYWMTAGGEHKEDRFGFKSSDPNPVTYTTTFSAPAGMFLDKTFWVEFR